MKIFTKKSVIFTALAVAFLATALVISCNIPDVVTSDNDGPSIPGTGKVSLSVNPGNASRTIVPTVLPTNTKYLLKLTGNGGTLSDFYATVGTGNVSVGNIPVGAYTAAQVFVYVSDTALTNTTAAAAYVGLAIGQSPAASATYNVNSTSSTPLGSLTTTLYAPGAAPGGAGTGTFTFDITDGTAGNGITAFEYAILGRGITSPQGSLLAFNDPNQSAVTRTIPSGAYDVIYSFTKGGNTAYLSEILYVYKGMTSSYPKQITDLIFPSAPGSGDGTVSITAPNVPEVPAFTFTCIGDGTNVTSTSNGFGWKVVVKRGANRVITLTTTAPDTPTNPVTNTTIGDWRLSGVPLTVLKDKGVSIDHTVSHIAIITLNTEDSDFDDFFDVTGNPSATYYTSFEVAHSSSAFTFNSPIIMISFID